ncbi:MAG: amidohydrolase family protein, partial [Bacillus sp. (in: firmicutes)]
AMGSYNDAYTYKLMRVLGLAELNFVANPLVNIHLQGRFDTYPKRRGLTRVKELDQNGLNVCFGHDDIMDPWYPIGNGNMLQVLHMGLHVSQLMGYSDIANSLRFVTDNSAKALQLKNYGIAEGNPANFVVLNAEDGYHALRLQAEILYSVRNGKVIAETKPRETSVFLQEQKNITFM